VLPFQNGFLHLSLIAERIASLTGKLAKIQILSDYFRSLGESELRLAALWLSGHAFPVSDAAPHQTGRAVIRAALLQASGLTEAEYRPLSRGLNDSGLTTETVLADSGGTKNPTLPEIATLLHTLRAAKGPAAKSTLLENFFRAVPPVASKYLVKILSGDLRIGLKEGLLEEALAAAFHSDPAAVREAHMLEGDLGQVAILARDQRLHESTLQVFQPLKCMLAIPEPDAAAIVGRLGEGGLDLVAQFGLSPRRGAMGIIPTQQRGEGIGLGYGEAMHQSGGRAKGGIVSACSADRWWHLPEVAQSAVDYVHIPKRLGRVAICPLRSGHSAAINRASSAFALGQLR
jgi:hypothetical protein